MILRSSETWRRCTDPNQGRVQLCRAISVQRSQGSGEGGLLLSDNGIALQSGLKGLDLTEGGKAPGGKEQRTEQDYFKNAVLLVHGEVGLNMCPGPHHSGCH